MHHTTQRISVIFLLLTCSPLVDSKLTQVGTDIPSVEIEVVAHVPAGLDSHSRSEILTALYADLAKRRSSDIVTSQTTEATFSEATISDSVSTTLRNWFDNFILHTRGQLLRKTINGGSSIWYPYGREQYQNFLRLLDGTHIEKQKIMLSTPRNKRSHDHIPKLNTDTDPITETTLTQDSSIMDVKPDTDSVIGQMRPKVTIQELYENQQLLTQLLKSNTPEDAKEMKREYLKQVWYLSLTERVNRMRNLLGKILEMRKFRQMVDKKKKALVQALIKVDDEITRQTTRTRRTARESVFSDNIWANMYDNANIDRLNDSPSYRGYVSSNSYLDSSLSRLLKEYVGSVSQETKRQLRHPRGLGARQSITTNDNKELLESLGLWNNRDTNVVRTTRDLRSEHVEHEESEESEETTKDSTSLFREKLIPLEQIKQENTNPTPSTVIHQHGVSSEEELWEHCQKAYQFYMELKHQVNKRYTRGLYYPRIDKRDIYNRAKYYHNANNQVVAQLQALVDTQNKIKMLLQDTKPEPNSNNILKRFLSHLSLISEISVPSAIPLLADIKVVNRTITDLSNISYYIRFRRAISDAMDSFDIHELPHKITHSIPTKHKRHILNDEKYSDPLSLLLLKRWEDLYQINHFPSLVLHEDLNKQKDIMTRKYQGNDLEQIRIKDIETEIETERLKEVEALLDRLVEEEKQRAATKIEQVYEVDPDKEPVSVDMSNNNRDKRHLRNPIHKDAKLIRQVVTVLYPHDKVLHQQQSKSGRPTHRIARDIDSPKPKYPRFPNLESLTDINYHATPYIDWYDDADVEIENIEVPDQESISADTLDESSHIHMRNKRHGTKREISRRRPYKYKNLRHQGFNLLERYRVPRSIPHTVLRDLETLVEADQSSSSVTEHVPEQHPKYIRLQYRP